jgi:DNA-binding transcriptional MerR regulator
MRVGELATHTGSSIRALRYYEESGLLHAKRRSNGYRDFDDSAVERVRVIRDLLDTGFTVEEIRSLDDCLPCPHSAGRCSSLTAALYRRKLTRIDHQLRTLNQLRKRIHQRLETLHPHCTSLRRTTWPAP